MMNFIADDSLLTLFFLLIIAFCAGFIDAIIGGGGLLQLPSLFIALPQLPTANLLGTNKFIAFFGTTTAAKQFAKRIKFNFIFLFWVGGSAFLFAFFGAKVAHFINPNTLKPIILIVLVLIAIYTFFKKDLGAIATKNYPLKKQIVYGACLAAAIGFYDGLIGPGTGSFFILGFVVVLGFEFIQASAYAKVINMITNIAALIVFVKHRNIIFSLGIIMAIMNITGSFIGSRLALKKGNEFIRKIFLFVIFLLIIRFAYDVWKVAIADAVH